MGQTLNVEVRGAGVNCRERCNLDTGRGLRRLVLSGGEATGIDMHSGAGGWRSCRSRVAAVLRGDGRGIENLMVWYYIVEREDL